jgi:ABC-2 type transport system permease protein
MTAMLVGTHRGVVRFAVALFATSISASMAQRGAFVMQAAFMAVNNAIFFTFWVVLFQRVPNIRGYGLPEMSLLYGVVAAAYGLAVTFAGGVRQLSRVIHDGELDALLAQPKPTLIYALGLRSQASGTGDMVSGLVLIGLSGTVKPATLPVVALAIVSAALVVLASGVMFHSLAFWLGRVDATARQLFETLITFSLYPEPLFGGALRLLLFTVLPAGFVGYVPARLVRDPSLVDAGLLLLAVTGYVAAAAWVFRRGLRSYSGGSRFGVFG